MKGLEQSVRAMVLATSAHMDQQRRDGRPYIEHPARVVAAVMERGQRYVAAAWLHDVIEDTGVDLGQLRREGFEREVVAAVALLTKGIHGDPDETNRAYLNRLMHNDIAREVKIADIMDNLGSTHTLRPGEGVYYGRQLDILLLAREATL